MQIISKCSPSAINTYNFCQFKYLLQYVLQLETQSGKAALQGTIVHDVFNKMAKIKKNNNKLADPMQLLEESWNKYTAENPNVEIRRTTSRGEAADFKHCRLAVENICNTENGLYNPYNMDIIDSERKFEIEFPGSEWKVGDSNFSIRGIIDLIHKIDNDTIEIIDFKTGQKRNFGSLKDKTYYDHLVDTQVRIYHLAASQIYSQFKNVIVTIYYTKTPKDRVTLGFDNRDIIETIAALYNFFHKVNNETLIKRKRGWRCRMCPFNKNNLCEKAWSDLHAVNYKYFKDKYSQLNIEEQKTI